MSIPPYDSVRDIPLLTDDGVMLRIASLIDVTTHPHVWLMYLDDKSRQWPALFPYEIPRRPNGRHPADLARLIGDVGEGIGASSVFLTYERPGPWRVTALDRTWLRTLREASALSGLQFRGPFLAHDSGVCLVPPDDYVGES